MNVLRNEGGLERSLPGGRQELRLSVVMPMYNENDGVETVLRRLGAVLDGLEVEAFRRGEALSCEIICIDDGSSDGTLAALEARRANEPRLKILALSRNFGKEVALAAGLRYANGDAVVIMDADLQHPPELIADFFARWREGYPVVYGIRQNGNSGSPLRNSASRLFHRMFAVLARTNLPPGACDFRLLDRKAVDALNALPERSRFTKGLYSWIGFCQIGVPFTVAQRTTGASGWSALRLSQFAVDAITSFSMIPLRFSSILGGVVSLVALTYAVYVVAKTMIYGGDLPGYPSLIVAIMFFAGVQLLSLGIIGEYLGRVFTEVKQRPLFIVSDEIGFAAADEDAVAHYGAAGAARDGASRSRAG
jgi:glycosyltransferase involved in cell wall biosynthesis